MIPERQAGDFLRFLALMLPDDRTFRGPVADNPDALDMFFRSAAKTYLRLAVAALELGFGAEHARRYLAESARAWIEYARRVPGAISPSDVERALAAAGVCERAACERFAAAYLATPAGRGEVIELRHWWHLADAMPRR